MIDPGQFTEDAFLGGQLRLRQPKSGHRAGHDAMLLAAATPARTGDRVVDLGAGVGAAGLALARRVAGISLVLVEIDPALAALAGGNAAANALAADVVVLDVTSEPSAFAAAVASAAIWSQSTRAGANSSTSTSPPTMVVRTSLPRAA